MVMCRRFSQTMASEWQTAFVVSHKMPCCALLTAVKNYNKSLEKLQDFFFKTETKTKFSRPRPRLHDPRPRPRLSFLSSRRLETKTLVSRATSLLKIVKDVTWPKQVLLWHIFDWKQEQGVVSLCTQLFAVTSCTRTNNNMCPKL